MLQHYTENVCSKPSHSLTWGIIEIFFRKSWSPSSDVKYLSIQIFPSGSAKRKRAAIRELFPAPVLPTIPTYRASQDCTIKPRASQGKWIHQATVLQHHRIYRRTSAKWLTFFSEAKTNLPPDQFEFRWQLDTQQFLGSHSKVKDLPLMCGGLLHKHDKVAWCIEQHDSRLLIFALNLVAGWC